MQKLFFILVIALVFPFALLSQEDNTVEFRYDDAGNRIIRYTLYIPDNTKSGKELDTIQNPDKLIPDYEVLIDNTLVSIYPNPTSGRFTVRLDNLPDNAKVTYALFALTGQLVLQGEMFNSENEFNLQNCENGTYLFKLLINSESTTWRIVKQ